MISKKSKVIAICGKLCSGKTFYAKQLIKNNNSVILSCDEMTKFLFDNKLGEKPDEMMKRIKEYLLRKAVDIIIAGTNVVLDWGFWSLSDRKQVSEFFNEKNIDCEWHYIDISDERLKINISKRNQEILKGENKDDFFVDDGLFEKMMTMWQEPQKNEIIIWKIVK